jgi:hypothetical protein
MDRVELTDETHPLTLDTVTGYVMPRPAGLKKPPADSSVAVLVDYILRLHADEVRTSGETPGMRPSEIAKEIDRQFGVNVAAKPINGRLWYLKSRNMVGWRENFYFLKDPTADPSVEAN